MSKQSAVILLGLWIALIPFLGIPSSWRTPLLIGSGLLVAVVGFLLRSRMTGREVSRRGLPFVENGHHETHEEIPHQQRAEG